MSRAIDLSGFTEPFRAFVASQSTAAPSPAPKAPQSTRYLKTSCDECGWTARVTRKHLEGRSLRCPDEYCDGRLERLP